MTVHAGEVMLTTSVANLKDDSDGPIVMNFSVKRFVRAAGVCAVSCALVATLSACGQVAHEAPSALEQLAKVLGHDGPDVSAMLRKVKPGQVPEATAKNWLERIEGNSEPLKNTCKIVSEVVGKVKISRSSEEDLYQVTSRAMDNTSVAALNQTLWLDLGFTSASTSKSNAEAVTRSIADVAANVC